MTGAKLATMTNEMHMCQEACKHAEVCAGAAAQSHKTPASVQGFSASAEDVPVLLMVDTAGCNMEEQAEEDGDSKRNEGEAKVRVLLNPVAVRLLSVQRLGKTSLLTPAFISKTETRGT